MTTPTDRALKCVDEVFRAFKDGRGHKFAASIIDRHFATPEGHVMLPTGEVVKVLGTPHKTTDGAWVIGYRGMWQWNGYSVRPSHVSPGQFYYAKGHGSGFAGYAPTPDSAKRACEEHAAKGGGS